MKPQLKAVCRLALLLSLFVPVREIYSQPPTIGFQSSITGLSAPIDIVNAGDGSNRLFIVERGGLIKVWNGTTTTDFMNVSSIISTDGERGLLSMAFHPGFNGTSNRFFFLYYTNTAGAIEISRYQTTSGNSNTGDAATKTTIITIPHPGQSNHNGGKIIFGSDGYLYFATGDGGGGNDVPNNAQNGNVLLGKMIRIDVNNLVSQPFGQYSIPADNPYVGDAAVLDEIWALGLRNPFRWSFDRSNGNMWIGDVGQGAKEEINYRPAGSTAHVNYGWRCYEGSISTPGVADCTPVDNVFPVFDYDNPNGGSPPPSAVTGGFVYRGNEFASLRGYYIAADFYSGTLYILWPNGSGVFNSATQTTGVQTLIAAFGEAEDGTLYAASMNTNIVYKLLATGGSALPVRLKNFTVQQFNTYNELRWSTSMEQGTSGFYIEYSTDGNHFIRAGHTPALRTTEGSNYTFRHYVNATGTVFYRLASEEDNGKLIYSSILKLAAGRQKFLQVYPAVVSNGIIHLSASAPVQKIRLINSYGVAVFEKKINSAPGATIIHLPTLNKGLYLVQVTAEGRESVHKIIVN